MVTPLGLSVDPFKNDTPRGVKEIRALLSIFIATAVFEDLACVRQKRKFWSRVNYQETFAHTRIRFGHVRARVVYTTSAFRCFMQDLRKPLY